MFWGRKLRPDVLVVGAGPVGMMTALRLARQGVMVRIVDGGFRTRLDSYALALHPRSLHLLDGLGLAHKLAEEGFRIERIRFFEGPADRPRLTLEFSKLADEFPFALVVPQHVLESTLEDQLRKHHVRVQWNHRAQAIHERPDEVVAEVARLDKAPVGLPVAPKDWAVDKVLETRCAYLVGADGCRSFVRDHLAADYRELGDKQTFSVFEFDTSMPLDHEVRVVLHDGMTNVLWPLSKHTCRWTFQIDESERSRTLQDGSYVLGSVVIDYLNDRLRACAPWFPPAEGQIRWAPVVQFARRLADTFGRRRIWLAGDAAHQTSPIGVQSLNAGLFEAWQLGGLLAEHVEGDRSPLRPEEYGEPRSREWRALLGMDRALRIRSDVDEWVRAQAGSILSSVPATGEDLRVLLRQAGLELAPIGDAA